MNTSGLPSVCRFYLDHKESYTRAQDIIKYCKDNNIPYKVEAGTKVGPKEDRSDYICVDPKYVQQIKTYEKELDILDIKRDKAINISINNKYPYKIDYLVKQLNYIFKSKGELTIPNSKYGNIFMSPQGISYTIDRVFIKNSRSSNGSNLMLTSSDNSYVMILPNTFASNIYNQWQELKQIYDVSNLIFIDILKHLASAFFTGTAFNKYLNDTIIYVSKF